MAPEPRVYREVPMDLSIVMSTRNRGDRVVAAVESIFRDQSCHWELIMVDQSSSGSTEGALHATGLLRNPRLTYRRTPTVGLSRGRNEGIRHAGGDVVAFTDDDCLVPPGWGRDLLRRFATMPEVSVLYASVIAASKAETGWVPEFHPVREGLVQLSPDVIRSLGLGANFSVRSSALAAIGPFDEFLGAGGTFGAAEDTDFGYRALRLGHSVYTAEEPAVVHCGLRKGKEVSATGSSYIRGMAAMCMKHVRCGDGRMVHPLAKAFRRRMAEGTRHLLRGRRPSGYGAAAAVLQGMMGSFRYRVDQQRRLYRRWTKGPLEGLTPDGQIAADGFPPTGRGGL